MKLFFALPVLIVISAVRGENASTMKMDSASSGSNYIVEGEVNCETQEIEFKVTAKTTGYVGFAIGNPHPPEGAPRSDLVIGGVYSNGTTYFADRHSTSDGKMAIDESQDWHLLDGIENKTHTILQFKRLLDTGDIDDVPIKSGPLKTSWAVGKTDKIADHGRDPNSRGYLNLNIPSCESKKVFEGTSRRRHATVAQLVQNLYDLEWEVDNINKEIEFLVTARTKGYIGFGLSYNGKMTNSDMIIGGVYPNGTAYFTDRHGPEQGHGEPIIDANQNWRLISAEENDTSTTIRFQRKIDTGDAEDIPISNAVKYIIWSLGGSDNLLYHGDQRGSLPIQLLDAELPPTVSEKIL